ncbi:potassium voltage-gated channel subfamily A member 1-like isoform X2 [Biomphalaria glabrata]|uniref:Potassium voltage-gated channel subfamily A member 1-like isoform X2 n=1 Tax=Biomphalaria glabrata TaxID=6526 RepID=A0A9W3A5Y6_BIOGL|nr:potassium voltage-gated channel subfamily A member 1-like isoform X2 [Biomphalaria glabrata]
MNFVSQLSLGTPRHDNNQTPNLSRRHTYGDVKWQVKMLKSQKDASELIPYQEQRRRFSLPKTLESSFDLQNLSEEEEPSTSRPLIAIKNFLRVDENENERASSYGKSLLEDLPEEHNCRSLGCERVVINVSGLPFETQVRTLNRFPETLLGNPEKRKQFWDEKRNEYFLDRHRPSFQAILYYYQSGGRLKKPLEVPIDIFLSELYFYELGDKAIDGFKCNEGFIMTNDNAKQLLPKTKWAKSIFLVMEYPNHSRTSKVYAMISVFMILTSVVTFCVETLPQLKDLECRNISSIDSWANTTYQQVIHLSSPLFIIETCCVLFFSTELVLRFFVTPGKVKFLKTLINWIDLASIAPFFLLLGSNLMSGHCGDKHKGSALTVLRVLRVVRILKLSKHSHGLRILGMTLKTSIRELTMFLLFLALATIIFSGAIYFVELNNPDCMFMSIPDAFWWAIVTMTTVGYGDYVPVGTLGKLIGGLCVLSGVLVIALPVPVIVANFNNYYRHYTVLRQSEMDVITKEDVSKPSTQVIHLLGIPRFLRSECDRRTDRQTDILHKPNSGCSPYGGPLKKAIIPVCLSAVVLLYCC